MPQVDTNGNTSIALRVGTWNLIGNPFTEPVLWADVLHVNALYNLQLIHYNGGYTESTSLVPFYGYYFDNRTANISTLKIPYNFQIDNQSNKKVTTIDWQLQLILITKTNSDSLNLIGIAKDAQLSRDQYDTRKPPLFQDLSFLYFDRPEWDPAMSKFNSDYRPALEEGQVWDFTISNPSKSEGKIYFLGIENVPLEYEIILLNSENSNLYDLRKDNQYFFANKTSKTNMQLIIGKASFIQKEAKKTIPTDFCLLQNYPNPFNQSTKITYTLPRNSKVIIEIFSLIGQHIIKLVDEFQTAGRHTVEWKGTNEKNEILTSGIYLCRIKVEEFQAFTRRLILLR